MYHKALLMGDEEVASEILNAETPGEAKPTGREIQNFQQEIWDDNRDRVVEEGELFEVQPERAAVGDPSWYRRQGTYRSVAQR